MGIELPNTGGLSDELVPVPADWLVVVDMKCLCQLAAWCFGFSAPVLWPVLSALRSPHAISPQHRGTWWIQGRSLVCSNCCRRLCWEKWTGKREERQLNSPSVALLFPSLRPLGIFHLPLEYLGSSWLAVGVAKL